MTIQIIDFESKISLIHKNTAPFCKQTIDLQSNTIVDVNNRLVNLNPSIYSTTIECSNDPYMSVNNLFVGQKIIVYSSIFFSIHVSQAMLNQTFENHLQGNDKMRKNAHEKAYLVNEHKAQEFKINKYKFDEDDEGKLMLYAPQFVMTVTKIEMSSLNQKNLWKMQALENLWN